LGRQKTSIIRRDLGQLSTLTANISRIGHDIDKGTQLHREQSLLRWRKKLVNFLLTKKVIDADVNLPRFKIRRDFGQLQTLTTNISGADRLDLPKIDNKLDRLPSLPR